MPLLFVSHSSRDRERLQGLVEWLERRGYGSLFVDADAQRGIAAGTHWEAELYRQLRRADAVIFVGSANSVASQWCFAELTMARSLGKPILPVSLSADVTHPLLGDIQHVPLESEKDLERVARGLRSLKLDQFAWDPDRSPFPGLAAFSEADAGVFFGRRRETDELRELLESSRRRHTGRLLAVVGPSGSGKSSLVAAGVLSRLRTRREWIVVPTVRPGSRPLRQLALALEAAFRAAGDARPLGVLEHAVEDPDAVVALAEELAQIGAEPGDHAVLLVIDQAEELLTAADPREGTQFLQLMHTVTRDAGPIWCVLTLRSEFLNTLLLSEGGARLFDDEILVGPLDRARLPEVIERPAARAGIELEPGLVARMVEDTGGGDALPLLAFALSELYEKARSADARVISGEDYDRLGGVVGALRSRADREFRHLGRAGLGDVVLPTLVRLVNLGPEGLPTRRRVALRGLDQRERTVIDAFVDARLVASGQSDGEAVVEVAHEALLRQWPPLEKEIGRSLDDLRLRTELEQTAKDWERSAYNDEYLISGLRVIRAQRLIDETSSITVKRFVESSARRQNRARTATARRRLAVRVAASIAALFLLVLVIRSDYWHHRIDETRVITVDDPGGAIPGAPVPRPATAPRTAKPFGVWQIVFAKKADDEGYGGRLEIFHSSVFLWTSTRMDVHDPDARRDRWIRRGVYEATLEKDRTSGQKQRTVQVAVCPHCRTVDDVAEIARRHATQSP